MRITLSVIKAEAREGVRRDGPQGRDPRDRRAPDGRKDLKSEPQAD
jgi:hypothetical protein